MVDMTGPIGIGGAPAVSAAGEKKPDSALSGTFSQFVADAEQHLQESDKAIAQANTGGAVDLHEVMIAMEKADISLRLIVQLRNKALEAYQEIMRMQV